MRSGLEINACFSARQASQGIYRSGRGARVTETTILLNEKLGASKAAGEISD